MGDVPKTLPPPPRSPGLKKKLTPTEAANERLTKRTGRPTDLERASETLPFESTLAYAFRGSGGKLTAVNAARLLADSDTRYLRFIHAWDTASETDRANLRLEDLCAAADLTPDQFLSQVIPALWRRNTDIGRVIAAISHPQVLEATIQSAVTGGSFGFQDRKVLHEAVGFLPTKQGTSINIDNSHKTVVAGGKPIEMQSSLPSFTTDINDFDAIVKAPQRSLPPAKSHTPEIVEAEFVQPEEE